MKVLGFLSAFFPFLLIPFYPTWQKRSISE